MLGIQQSVTQSRSLTSGAYTLVEENKQESGKQINWTHHKIVLHIKKTIKQGCDIRDQGVTLDAEVRQIFPEKVA